MTRVIIVLGLCAWVVIAVYLIHGSRAESEPFWPDSPDCSMGEWLATGDGADQIVECGVCVCGEEEAGHDSETHGYVDAAVYFESHVEIGFRDE